MEGESMHISKREREIMEHALGYWYDTKGQRFRKGDRNSFVTGPESDDWPFLERLCDLGLMCVTMRPADDRGGMSVFGVTAKGRAEISAAPAEQRAGSR